MFDITINNMNFIKILFFILLFSTLSFADNVTPNFISLGASTSGTIPINAKGWTVTILTGSATIGGQNVLAGFSDEDKNSPLAAIIISTGSSSSAYIRYNQ